MSLIGKRLPYKIPYEVGFDDEGRIGSFKMDFIADAGYGMSEANTILAIMHAQNTYKAIGWEMDSHTVLTNTPSNTACRAPGSVKSIAVVEWVMEHIAHFLKKDPLEVRLVNLLETGDSLLSMFGPMTFDRVNRIPEMLEMMKEKADYEKRKEFVEKWNLENRWKKRGLALVPVRYEVGFYASNFPASVAVYHKDGHVAVSHGAVEMGQGLNTKVRVVVK